MIELAEFHRRRKLVSSFHRPSTETSNFAASNLRLITEQYIQCEADIFGSGLILDFRYNDPPPPPPIDPPLRSNPKSVIRFDAAKIQRLSWDMCTI